MHGERRLADTSCPSAATVRRVRTTIFGKPTSSCSSARISPTTIRSSCQHLEANPTQMRHRRRPAGHQDRDARRSAPAAQAAHRYRAAERHRASVDPREDLINRAYIERHTTGFDELAKLAREVHTRTRCRHHRTIGRADPSRPRYRTAEPRPPSLRWTMGVNHSTQGAETVNAINNLALLTGQIGRAGASPFSITGQCNAMGTRECGCTSSLPGYRKFENAEHRRETRGSLERGCRANPRHARPRVSRHHRSRRLRRNQSALDHCHESRWSPIRIRTRLRRGLANLDFFVVQDGFHPDADHGVRRPCSARRDLGRERGRLHELRAPRVKANKAVEPPGEARSDFDIFLALAEKLGCRQELFRGWRTVWDAWEEWRKVSRGRPLRLLRDDIRFDGAARRSPVAVPRRNNGFLAVQVIRRRSVRARRRQSAAAAHRMAAVSRAAFRRLSVRAEHGAHGRALAHAHQDGPGAAARTHGAERVARDESERRQSAGTRAT